MSHIQISQNKVYKIIKKATAFDISSDIYFSPICNLFGANVFPPWDSKTRFKIKPLGNSLYKVIAKDKENESNTKSLTVKLDFDTTGQFNNVAVMTIDGSQLKTEKADPQDAASSDMCIVKDNEAVNNFQVIIEDITEEYEKDKEFSKDLKEAGNKIGIIIIVVAVLGMGLGLMVVSFILKTILGLFKTNDYDNYDNYDTYDY
jgi:hypothetical protein